MHLKLTNKKAKMSEVQSREKLEQLHRTNVYMGLLIFPFMTNNPKNLWDFS